MESLHVSDRAIWNGFVRQAPNGHICQTYEWPEHIGDAARRNSLRLGVFDRGRLAAAVLLVYNEADIVHAPFYYAPRGPVYASGIGPDSLALRELLAFARREAAKRGAFMVHFEPNIAEPAPAWARRHRALGLRATRQALYPRSAWVTDISRSEDELLAAMTKGWRYGIRRGTREGVTVRCGRTERDFESFYALLRRTGERNRFHVYAAQLYRDMLADYSPEHAAANGTAEMPLFLAEHAGAPVAAATVAVHGARAWYMHGALADGVGDRHIEANRVLLWRCVQWAKSQGATSFDWRSIPEEPRPGEELYGVYAFKRGFGGAAQRVIPSQDLVLRPVIYWPYLAAITLRQTLRAWRRRRFERERQAAHPAAPAPRRPEMAPQPGHLPPRPRPSEARRRQASLSH
ncbi:MAG TPA: peptidoglycan bridge formation glycyltransferase FemA/FemB family protein [Ktedonobacterales bacterium]|nr:peptidoglycan bridge formation glycyltransferase FemA/FemB family protein [Ktedonobacterales bacterium]